MQPYIGRCRRALAVASRVSVVLAVSSIMCSSVGFAGQTPDTPARVPRWPCRLVVNPTLRRVVEDGWERSATLRQQCDELAAARAVVVLEWGSTDSQSQAIARTYVDDGVVVAKVKIPPARDAIVLVAHELQHVLERVRGLDFQVEARRPGSGVWRAFGGYETQAAIDAGRQIAKELRDTPRVSR